MLKTDVSRLGMMEMLCEQGLPICCYSKKFYTTMLKASTFVRDLFAVTLGSEEMVNLLTSS